MNVARDKRFDWLIVLCVNLAIPVMILWKRHTGELGITMAAISGVIALAIVNVAVLISIRARNARRGYVNSRTLVFSTLGVAVLSAGTMLIGLISVPAHNGYVDLAFSSVPLSQIHPEQKALVVELIRRKAANSRQYADTTSKTKPLSPPLYSVESFADPDVMGKTVEQLKTATDVDFAYYGRQQEAEIEFRKKMDLVDPDYLKSLDAINLEDASEKITIQLEQQWFSSTSALYQYGASHHKEITILDGVLKFAAPDVQTEFNQELERSKKLHSELQKRVLGSVKDKERERARVIVPTPSQIPPP